MCPFDARREAECHERDTDDDEDHDALRNAEEAR
jgi:hypothetical protein